ncbi:MAG: hypothetical protein AAB414_03425 [Patescibacteria group bacterium]
MNQKGFAPIFVLIGILVLALIAGGVFYLGKINNTSPGTPSKTEWKGVIWNGKGFITVNSKGEIVKDQNRNVNSVLPPGMKSNYIVKNFTSISNNGEDIFKNAVQLLDDGRLIFIGSSDIGTAIREDTLYSWKFNAQELPKPLMKLPQEKKIRRFTFSPDKKKVAIISISADEKELDKELDIIHIFNVDTQQLITNLKIDRENEDTGLDNRLAWRGNYLYVFTTFQFRVFDMNNNQLFYTSDKSESGPMGDNVIISPDGSKFIYMPKQKVEVLQALINPIELKMPALINYNAFSFDSKKMLIQKSKKTDGPLIGDEIGELNLENGEVDIIGSIESLASELQLDYSTKERYFLLPFIVYNPAADYIIFPIVADGNALRFVDLYSLKLDEQHAKTNLLEDVEMITTLRDFAFLGWYKTD